MDKKYKMNKEKSISLLNEAIADELRALHQYMYFHFHCDDKGYDLLADLFKKPLSKRCSMLRNWQSECFSLAGM
jgi:bacterioferritin (cytochrome b1)